MWVASRDNYSMRVEEWIEAADGEVFSEVSQWYWSAFLGRSQGPWVAHTLSLPLDVADRATSRNDSRHTAALDIATVRVN